MRFFRRQQMADETDLLRLLAPLFPARHVRLVLRAVEDAATAKAEIQADFAAQLFPALQAAHRQRQFVEVAVLLPYPAPVAPGLLAADRAFLEQRHRNALLRQFVGDGGTDNAAADHHHIDLVGKGRAVCDSIDFYAHRETF